MPLPHGDNQLLGSHHTSWKVGILENIDKSDLRYALLYNKDGNVIFSVSMRLLPTVCTVRFAIFSTV